MSLCNESKLLIEKGRVARSGLPTEASLKVLNEKIAHYDPAFKARIRPVTEAVEQYNDYLT
jgi:Ca2+-transporting ATPase